MSLSTKNPVDAVASILLVEGYEALAVAFGTVLRRLAPDRETRAVQSLAEAEAAIRKQPPDLLIIDFDPPPLGAIEFFKRLKLLAPDLHVLILGVGTSQALALESRGPVALQFLEKPFELADFGRAVQTLLDSAGKNSDRTLRHLNLSDLIALSCIAGTASVLAVHSTGSHSGEIHFNDGQIVHAVAMEKEGAAALREILQWIAPRFEVISRRVNTPRTIRGAWATVLRDALRSAGPVLDEPTHAVAQPPRPRTIEKPQGKKIVVIDDTETLLDFVEDVLVTADATLQIITAASGLEGLRRVIATKPDLILLDYSLPDITGDEVCQRLQENEETARLPVVMMSGHVPEMLATAERHENVVATIAKPFLSSSLIDLVQRTMAETPKAAASRAKKKKSATPSKEKVPEPPKSKNGRHLSPAIAPVEPVSTKVPEPEAAAFVEPPATAIEIETPAPAIVPAAAPAPEQTATLAQKTGPPAIFEPITPSLVRISAASSPTPISAPALSPASRAETTGITRVAVPEAKGNAVVLALPLEALSIQFSPALQIKAIRARPSSRTVSLHMLPQTIAGISTPETGFELARVTLDQRGQVDVVHLAPTSNQISRLQTQRSFPVADVAAVEGAAVHLTPSRVAPIQMQLLALFHLAGVELSMEFGVRHLVLKSSGEKMRVSLQPEAAHTGVTFLNAQFVLDSSARLEEVRLDTVA